MLLSLVLLAAQTVRLEAEDATIASAKIASSRPGFSGKGYVTDLTASNARLEWSVDARGGLYRAFVRYQAGSKKGFAVGANARTHSGMLEASGEAWARHDAGLVELKPGKNTVSIERGWGYYDVDYLELVPAKPIAPPRAVKPVPVDPKANARVRKVLSYLASQYGKATVSGGYGLSEAKIVQARTGELPAILGGDFMDYSPSRLPFGADPKGHTEEMVKAAREGYLVTMSWHWNAPSGLKNRKEKNEKGEELDLSWYRGFYSNATTFDLAQALANPQGEDYGLIVRDIDAIAKELRKFGDIPVLWRPLHEAEGGWFWWGAKGPEPCKKLWRLLFDRLTNHHRLHNLIWVWNSAAAEWYPGDATVDLLTIDAYPSDRLDPLARTWEDLLRRFDGKKMIGVAEFPGALDVDRAWRFGARWAFFVSWTGSLGPGSTDPAVLKRVYKSPRTISKRELPRL